MNKVNSNIKFVSNSTDDLEEIKRRNLTKWSEEHSPKEDRVHHPSHYAWLKELCGIEPMDICRHLNYNEGNICKYLLRKNKKDIISPLEKRIEDLEKIIVHAKDEIERLKSKYLS